MFIKSEPDIWFCYLYFILNVFAESSIEMGATDSKLPLNPDVI